jgi:Asp-tRNA(Asn)/Glu-tRNA(Gln) amidotransferase B subunit
MKLSGGKANPKLVNDMLKEKLKKWPRTSLLMKN